MSSNGLGERISAWYEQNKGHRLSIDVIKCLANAVNEWYSHEVAHKPHCIYVLDREGQIIEQQATTTMAQYGSALEAITGKYQNTHRIMIHSDSVGNELDQVRLQQQLHREKYAPMRQLLLARQNDPSIPVLHFQQA